ncbi:hypothetical protein B0H11DRAFT_359228 [Mycena galericulata]|nr:hypothetical protein B0H11DRAFT_359228 [Mycena galericulata]
MSSKIVYLVSGANRGIGYGLVASLAARPSAIVFAGARDPAGAQSLKDLAAKHPNVHVVKLTSGDKADNEAAISEIRKIAGQLDVIIANAAVMKYFGPLATTPVSEFHDHFGVNTIGPVVLFQAAHSLLLASPSGAPAFVVISSIAGSIGRYQHSTAAAYGSSKAALNFLVKVLDHEYPTLIAFSISPGWVSTDMGNTAAVAVGYPQAPDSVEDSVAGTLARIDEATKEKTSGRFLNFKLKGENHWDIEGDEVPW